MGPSYFALIATGTNTLYSHYHRNTAKLQDGDLVQFDYAPDYKYYQSDVTRVFPANGTLHAAAARVLRHLPAAVSGADDVDQGARVAARHHQGGGRQDGRDSRVIPVHGRARSKRRRRHSSSGIARALPPAWGTGSGMEVHDVGGPAPTLEPGMVFTIEPAMQIPEEHIGIRLEDMILITESGYENLSAFVPVEIRRDRKAHARAWHAKEVANIELCAMANLTRPDEALALRTTLLCGLVVVLEGYDLSTLGFVVPQLAEAWSKPPVAFTTALTASNLGMFVGAVICGWLGDRYGRKPVLLGCIAGFGITSLLTAFAADTTQLALARLATGVALGGGIPVCIALVSDVSPPHRQGALVIAMITGVVVGNLVCRYRGGPPALVVRVAVRLHRRRRRADTVVAAGCDLPARVLSISGDSSRTRAAVGASTASTAQPRGGALRPWCRRRDGAALGHQLSQPAHDLLRELLAAVNASRHGSDGAGRHCRVEHVLHSARSAPRL